MLKNKPPSFIRSYLISIELWDIDSFDTFSPLSNKWVKRIKPVAFENGSLYLKTLITLIAEWL